MAPAFDSVGFAATFSFWKNFKERATDAARDACEEICRQVFERSQYYVPVSVDGSYGASPGALKQSGYYAVYGGGGREVYGIISYGDARVFYAAYVHERLDAYHESPTQAKFVTQAVKDVGPGLGTLIAKKFFFTMEGHV